jgi:hypothetical protein
MRWLAAVLVMLGSAVPASASQLPDAPEQLVATRGVRQLTLSWQTPSSGGPVETYLIQQGPPWQTVGEIGGQATEWTEHGLPNGFLRNYQVIAVNSSGRSPAAGPVSARTYRLPTMPAGLGASPGVLPGEIRLAWSQPVDTDGLPVLEYVIYEASTIQRDFERVGDAPGWATTRILSGRSLGIKYEFQLTAVTAVGGSLPSDSACARAHPWPLGHGCQAQPPAPVNALTADLILR